MRVLFIGDVVGRPGRDIICDALPGLIVRERLDAVIVNAENAAGGSGLTPQIYKDLIAAGVDGITLGDHVYRRREIQSVLEREANIVRPANLPEEAVGRTWATVPARNGGQVGFCCVLGQLFMNPVDNPWRAADRALAAMPGDVTVRMVDIHVEATSEAQLLGRYFDGRATAVLGTHTHVATADEQILPGGTAFQCDVGMTGPHDSILGRRIDRVMETKLTANPTQFEVASGDVRINGAVIEADDDTGRAVAIARLCVYEADVPALAALASKR
ncbi:MAG: YmdB family metallophosphoesterase [Pirellulales bacterium]|nr:YmdB family metallophosphoesterase [Pirellulales bacterium]